MKRYGVRNPYFEFIDRNPQFFYCVIDCYIPLNWSLSVDRPRGWQVLAITPRPQEGYLPPRRDVLPGGLLCQHCGSQAVNRPRRRCPAAVASCAAEEHLHRQEKGDDFSQILILLLPPVVLRRGIKVCARRAWGRWRSRSSSGYARRQRVLLAQQPPSAHPRRWRLAGRLN